VDEEELISLAMKALRRRVGSKPGDARAAALSPERRREIAKAAARARWGKKRKAKRKSE
jgi:hypothetical protein